MAFPMCISVTRMPVILWICLHLDSNQFNMLDPTAAFLGPLSWEHDLLLPSGSHGPRLGVPPRGVSSAPPGSAGRAGPHLQAGVHPGLLGPLEPCHAGERGGRWANTYEPQERDAPCHIRRKAV